MSQCKDEVRTALYRFYDSAHYLLYVGISDGPWRRWREHVLTQPWYPLVKHWTVTWYDSEPQARQAELRAIRGELPRFNTADAPDPVPVRFILHPSRFAAVAVIWWLLPMVLTTVIVTCAPWHWLVIATVILALSEPVPLALLVLVGFAPEIRRFALWLDRHVIREHADADLSVGTEKAKAALEIARRDRERKQA